MRNCMCNHHCFCVNSALGAVHMVDFSAWNLHEIGADSALKKNLHEISDMSIKSMQGHCYVVGISLWLCNVAGTIAWAPLSDYCRRNAM